MEVYNQDKTKILKEYDREKGEIISDTIIIHHEAVTGVPAKGHYEVIKEYKNGGKDYVWIEDEPGVEPRDAYDEIVNICVYVPYTEKELRIKEYQKQLNDNQNYLAATDYLVIKLVEGLISQEEYEQYKPLRQEARENINKYKKLLEEEGEQWFR